MSSFFHNGNTIIEYVHCVHNILLMVVMKIKIVVLCLGFSNIDMHYAS